MNKKLKGLLCLLGALLLYIVNPLPAGALTLSFEPTTQSVTLGSQASVNVMVSQDTPDDNLPVVSTFSFNVNFDSALLSFADLSYGTSLGGPSDSIPWNTPGTGTVGVAEVSMLGINDLMELQDGSTPFLLCTLTFDTIVAGVSPLSFNTIVFGSDSGELDEFGNPIVLALDVNPINGSINITGGTTPVPEPGTLLLLCAGLLGVLCVRRRFTPKP
jgi:hypothetical protein